MAREVNRRVSMITSVLLALILTAVLLPGTAFAEPEDDVITVWMTISDEGNIASTKDGDAIAWKRVFVSDVNQDGRITMDEALGAAHFLYYKDGSDGYAVSDAGMVTRFWGKDTAGLLFFIDQEPLDKLVTDTVVENGSMITAAIMKDTTNWADWFATYGGQTNYQFEVGETITFTMRGYFGMSQKDGLQFKPVEGVTIGAWIDEDTPFKPITTADGSVLKTDEEGSADITFTEPGTYIITAQGTVNREVLGQQLECPIIAPVVVIDAVYGNQIKVTPKTVTVKANKKTTIKASKAFTVKGRKGTLTYTQKTKNSKIKVRK